MTKEAENLYATAPGDRPAWLAQLDLQMTIDGEDAPANARSSLTDPCTEEPLATYPDAEMAHVDRSVEAAKRAFRNWSQTGWDERREALDSLAKAIGENHAELAILLACETGRPLRKAWHEIHFSVEFVRMIAGVKLPARRFDQPGREIELTHRPLGVSGAIAPWNAPVILGIAKVANALLAGDTVVLRPSPFTPLTALYLGRLGRSVLPPGVFNVITGDASIGAALTVHPDVAKISFTGSTATGRRIAAAAAPQLKRLTLELGGNDAAIVLKDADVEAFADKVFEISLGNAGHFCSAAKRLYIHSDVFADVRDALMAKAEAVVCGDNFDPSTTMTPVQNRPQFDRIWSVIDDAVAHGGRVVTGAAREAGPGLFITPTLFEDISHGTMLVDEEQFGPVLPLIPFDDLEDAVAMANDSEYGLGGSIWSSDLDQATEWANRLETGSAWINDHGSFSASVPMPSAKQSGIGTDYAHFGVAEHSRLMILNRKVSD
ncbi:aldehyde dehydrogenase family protein [Parasphingopyxis algicola]|uniref:aldehyde dehydrogenase family protein n=1 Tax=Parasphingopyxis algicola TaxID=2026624 RepID=UPI0015A0BD4B|nr:aldehyde dehydrogenase family protein [Parasphingopyxis algicola]QLC26373.1 aldehyde dehydrogenase family protein [Parasphingopyxis algicola]